LHVTAVAASLALFVLRGIWRMQAPERLELRWVRIVPHVVDTALLASAIGLAAMLESYPGKDGWLTAKVAALVVYILLGSIALKRGRTPGIRAAAFVAALVTFGYIVSVALSKSPAGFFQMLAVELQDPAFRHTTTGIAAWLRTFTVSLPSIIPVMPRCPCDAMQIASQPAVFAASMMAT
jgi:uncharacterized membrane protein SirB2